MGIYTFYVSFKYYHAPVHAQLNRNATSILRQMQSQHRDKEPSERHAQKRKGCGQGHLPQLRNLSLPNRKGLTAPSNTTLSPNIFPVRYLPLVEPFNWNRRRLLRENRGQGHLRLSAWSNRPFGLSRHSRGNGSTLDTSAGILPRWFRHAQLSASLRHMRYLCDEHYRNGDYLFSSDCSTECRHYKWSHNLLSTHRLEGQ